MEPDSYSDLIRLNKRELERKIDLAIKEFIANVGQPDGIWISVNACPTMNSNYEFVGVEIEIKYSL